MQQADAADEVAKALRGELTELRKSVDAQAARAAQAAVQDKEAPGESATVKELRSEVAFLRSTNAALMLLVGGQKEEAAKIMSKASGLPGQA